MTNKIYAWALAALCCAISLGAQTPYLHNIDAILQDAEQKHGGRIGFSLARLSDKQVLYEYRARESFIPASVAKIFSSGASLRELGGRYRFATDIYAVGKIVGDTLEGSLLIKGSGDPSLGTGLISGERYRFGRELVAALEERGIKHITGSVYLDASLPTGVGPMEGWAAEDLKHAYGAGLFGLNYADNKIEQASDPNPAATLAAELMNRLYIAGISLGKAITHSYEGYETEGVLLHSYYSRPLSELARVVNHRSMNMYAEALGQALRPERNRGSALTSYWQQALGLSASELLLDDGSGLSRRSRLSPRACQMALTTLFGQIQPEDGLLVESLPRLGREGTLSNLMPETTLQAYLKSGTMRRVSTYAGYVHYGGEWYAIVYFTNDIPQARTARGVFSAIMDEVFYAG